MTISVRFYWFFIFKVIEFEAGMFKHFNVPIYMYDCEHYKQDWEYTKLFISIHKFWFVAQNLFWSSIYIKEHC
jgi:hypothetical protein